jgi:hypothetical protein
MTHSDIEKKSYLLPSEDCHYIGVKDIKGKCIHVGHIVEIDGDNYEVKCVHGKYIVSNKNNMRIVWDFDCLVVGNVFEDLELLK